MNDRSTLKVTARDEQARAWLAQGPQLGCAFEHAEAVRVFRAALARDPGGAEMVCGVLGPKINAHGPNEHLHLACAKRLTAAVAAMMAAHPWVTSLRRPRRITRSAITRTPPGMRVSKVTPIH